MIPEPHSVMRGASPTPQRHALVLRAQLLRKSSKSEKPEKSNLKGNLKRPTAMRSSTTN